jgi:branched-chain amino acid aminotransferase
MITEMILGNRYCINGISVDVSGFVPDMSADTYYEVVRLIDGKLLFLPDHLERLRHSLSASGTAYPGDQMIKESLGLLIHENPFTEGNIRICLQRINENKLLLQCYFIPYVYPDACMYKKGVKLVTYPYQRPNPGIKKWDDLFRKRVGEYIRKHGVYEAALINQENLITEGSRSNIFYIDQPGKLITVPEKHILPGITRKYVLEIATNRDITILEKAVTREELESMAAVFISGTSPKVLPVNQIDEQCFDVNHSILHLLMEQFEQLVQKNLSSL